MTKQRLMRAATAAMAVTSLSVLAGASSAPAVEHHPKGGFAPFADCPLSLVSLNTCIVAEIGSGSFTVGRKTVPISAKLTFQGGLLEDEEAAARLDFVAAEDGNTLSKTALSVPGGLTGVVAAGYLPTTLREAFNRAVSQNMTGVTLTAELARPASAIELSLANMLHEEGVGLRLPVKARLNNPFLGASCYIGSSSNPIVLNLTTGSTSPPAPNRQIKGTLGPLSFMEEAIVVLPGASLVDNAFATPGASGCGGSYSALVDPAIDAQLGLPSAAGHNTAILNGKMELTGAETVREKE